jgi:ABC-type ATPase with predicted acetyltransferase domain
MSSQEPSEREVTFGQPIYDEDGNELGRVRGLDEHGFYVTSDEGVVAMSTDHEAGAKSGHKELHWRCWECGEIGKISEMPETCPACGAPEEDLYYWQQD